MQNLSGARSKVHAFNSHLASTHIDLYALTETWFDQSVNDSVIVGSTNYTVIRRDRSEFTSTRQLAGGVCFIIKNDIPYNIFHIPMKTSIEVQAIRVFTKEQNYAIFNVYLPPYERLSKINELGKVLKYYKSQHPNDELILLGDFNMASISWAYDRESAGHLSPIINLNTNYAPVFLRLLATYKLQQMCSVINSLGKTLDLVLTTCSNELKVSQSLFTEAIDNFSVNHKAATIMFSIIPKEHVEQIVETKVIRLKAARSELAKLNLVPISQDDIFTALSCDCDSLIGKIDTTLEAIIRVQAKHTITKRVPLSVINSKHPWTRNKKYQALMTTKRKLQKKLRADTSLANRTLLAYQAKVCAELYNKLKHQYYCKIIGGTSNTNQLYKIIKSKTKPQNRLPNCMSRDGAIYQGNERYEEMLTFIGSCYVQSSFPFSQIPNVLCEQLDDIHREYYSDINANDWNEYVNDVEPAEIIAIIDNLDIDKDPGPHQISTSFIKFCKSILAPVITNIFNAIFATGVMPPNWKLSYVIPIPKKGSANEITNYRGISIQSVLPKMLDKIIAARLAANIAHRIPKIQHGFMPKRSTITNMATLTYFMYQKFSERKEIDVIYIDFRKAFDKIDHFILAQKLLLLAVPFTLFKTIMSFVTTRTYQLKCEGVTLPSIITSNSSVAQGSISGPILFNIVCHDIDSCIANTLTMMLQFADDTKMYRVIEDHTHRAELQMALGKLVNWCERNKIDINIEKTYHMKFTRRRTEAVVSCYFINNRRIQTVDQIKDLGMIFDRKLTFKTHIKNVVIKLNQQIAAARRFAKEIGSRRIILNIFKQYLIPLHDYGSIFWKCTIREENQIEQIQSAMTRFYLHSPFRFDHPNHLTNAERLDTMELQLLKDRRKINAIVYLFKMDRRLVDCALCDIVEAAKQQRRNTRSRLIFNINYCTGSDFLSRTMSLANT